MLDDDDDMPTVDESVETFAKLKRVQPKQQELQRRLEQVGTLDEDDAEALDYLNDEVQSLLEILQQHGFNIPGCAHCSFNPQTTVNLLQIDHACTVLLRRVSTKRCSALCSSTIHVTESVAQPMCLCVCSN